jgi:hypothetical protein
VKRRRARAILHDEREAGGLVRDGLVTSSLCETCQNMREVRTARSRFLLCELSATRDGYPKYPPQPVVRCEGHEAKEEKQTGEYLR